MAQVLAAVPTHGLEAVLVAVELSLESGRPSAEHVLNLLTRLKDATPAVQKLTLGVLALREEPQANVRRYDALYAHPAEPSSKPADDNDDDQEVPA